MVAVASVGQHHWVDVVRIVRIDFYAAFVVALRAVLAVREHVIRHRTVAFLALTIHVRIDVVELREMLVQTHVVVLRFAVVLARKLRELRSEMLRILRNCDNCCDL